MQLPKGSHLALIFSLASSITAHSPSNSSVPKIDLGYVQYAGYANETAGVNYYRGIKYASAPTGPLRWQKPSPIEADPTYTGQIIQATTLAPACYQALPTYLPQSFAEIPQGQSEDCLILDVLVPSKPSSENLPVMLQIHGGGYGVGNALTFPGDAMVNASDGGLIYVSIQYRLNIFGFLAGSEVKENGVQNAGLYDQRAAIEWVQRHISAFGGDPSKITIWGGSAGGSSVTYQLMAAGGIGVPPFRAAIAEYPWWQPLLNSSTQEIQFDLALQASGCSDINCLRQLSSDDLASAGQANIDDSYRHTGDGYGTFWFGPVVDGDFIQDLPDVAFKKGDYYKVPLLVDREGYEGVIFSNGSQTTQIEETMDAQNLFPSAGPAFFSRLYQLYPRSAYNSTFFQRQSWFGDFIINCPTYQIATSAVDHTSNSSAVFKLVFDAGTQLHGATSDFLASNITGWPSANNHTFAAIMSSYWISFATTLDPNPLRIAEAPFWPSYVSDGAGSAAEGESVGFEILDVTYGGIQAVEDPDARIQCEFFLNKGYTLRN
ncbi:Lipase 2 [Cytospora mali]|uniref:Carboxylic ester hydrolase n=1 Tax=Cytospora mali TaxID=578113 RepID=A0A194W1R8_CYTMA|nr:Lipase 2 [Valsa mali]